MYSSMKIGSRFWGTSGFARPNGGAGWFTSAPGADYLSQFQQVHLPGINDVGAFATAAGEQLARLMVRGPRKGLKSFFQRMGDTQTTLNFFERPFSVTLRASNPRFKSVVRRYNSIAPPGAAYDAIGFTVVNTGNFMPVRVG